MTLMVKCPVHGEEYRTLDGHTCALGGCGLQLERSTYAVWATQEDREEAERDAQVYGTSFVKKNAEGYLVRVDPMTIRPAHTPMLERFRELDGLDAEHPTCPQERGYKPGAEEL